MLSRMAIICINNILFSQMKVNGLEYPREGILVPAGHGVITGILPLLGLSLMTLIRQS